MSGRSRDDARRAIQVAEDEVHQLIAAALAGREKARLTRAPAGAGKSEAVVRLACALADQGANVGVVSQTNEQARDLVRRIAQRRPVGLLHATNQEPPPEIARIPNVSYAKKLDHLTQQAIVVATADKWAYTPSGGRIFDAGVVDEAYQMTSAKLYRIASLFSALDLLGDPGQIDPFTTVEDLRWRGLSTNPVLAAPDTLLDYHPQTPVHSLSVTRRLPPTAVEVVRRAFYPDLRFAAASSPGDRQLALSLPAHLDQRVAQVWRLAAESGWAYLELPERLSAETDREIACALADLAEGLLAARPAVKDERHGGKTLKLTAERVAAGVAHRSQRKALRIELDRRGLRHVEVDTANRLQGREFDVTLVWHPLAGRGDATAFHLDAGRMAVLATRHRHACVIVGRAGVPRLLDEHPPPAEHHLGLACSSEFIGWEAHRRVLEHLETVTIRH